MANAELNTNDFTAAEPRGYWIIGETICRVNGRRLVLQMQARLQLFASAAGYALQEPGREVGGPLRAVTEATSRELRGPGFLDGKWGPLTSLVLWNLAIDVRAPAELLVELERLARGNGPLTHRVVRFAIAATYYMPTSGTRAEQRDALFAAFDAIRLRASDVNNTAYPTASVLILPLWNRGNPALRGQQDTAPPACSPFRDEVLGPGVTFTPDGQGGAQPEPQPPAPSYGDGGGSAVGGVVLLGSIAAVAAAIGWRYQKRNRSA